MSSPNPYAAPKARVSDVESPARDIDSLDVSETWRTRFRLIEAAGGTRVPELKSLAFGDRARILFNLLAFLFGPFYYLAKGLWRQAISYFLLGVISLTVLLTLLEIVGMGGANRALSYALAAVFATRANLDYYKLVVLNQKNWL